MLYDHTCHFWRLKTDTILCTTLDLHKHHRSKYFWREYSYFHATVFQPGLLQFPHSFCILKWYKDILWKRRSIKIRMQLQKRIWTHCVKRKNLTACLGAHLRFYMYPSAFNFLLLKCILSETNYLHTIIYMTYFKVHIFWEGHKILRKLHLRFVLCSNCQIYSGDFAKFCGLLRIYEL